MVELYDRYGFLASIKETVLKERAPPPRGKNPKGRAKIQGKDTKNPRALDESHRADSQARRGFPGDRGSKIQKSTNFGGNEKVEGLDFCQREKDHTASRGKTHTRITYFFGFLDF